MPESDTKTDISPAETIRLRIQLEIMLLTWVRTALSLMAFGFVIARFGLFLKQIASVGEIHVIDHPQLALANTVAGTVMILLGVVMLLASIVGHLRTVDRLQRGEMPSSGRWSLGVVLSACLAAIGTGMAIYLTILEM
jgi:putative membrane protein